MKSISLPVNRSVLGSVKQGSTNPQLHAASLQIPSGLRQVRPALQTVLLPSQDEPAQPWQGPDELAAVQTPLTHEDGFWHGVDASQGHPLQLEMPSVYFVTAIVLLSVVAYPQLQAALLQTPSGARQVRPSLQTAVLPSHCVPRQPAQLPEV
jgi:hypothetical protein